MHFIDTVLADQTKIYNRIKLHNTNEELYDTNKKICNIDEMTLYITNGIIYNIQFIFINHEKQMKNYKQEKTVAVFDLPV